MSKVILITGASRGFGKLWAKAFLEAGNKVVATARNLADLEDLVLEFGNMVLPLQLDVKNRTQCIEVVNFAKETFGQLDVVINNAGFGLFGAVEEVNEVDVKNQFETNVYGSLWIIQAALPIMRAQRSGHIIQLSSLLGIVSIPTMSIYNATKFALEAIIEALSGEVNHLGINTTLIEPNAYTTDFGGDSALHSGSIDIYDDVKNAVLAGFNEDTMGDPLATIPAILEIVNTKNPPLRVFFGKVGYTFASEVYAKRLAEWEAWKEFSIAAQK
ncbi:short-chain dehydrogenase [Pedobacter sp. Leaf216]|uniref:SDR family NAD(P)-dependent oxidoreductase n=1 Tax=Pedobacter sp. Leaf216 TaxID=1735684 RepID=UPI0006FBA5E8|nr:SDR family NAD(P)-dependent oxidoreductase [Pedobacter sp. Leaf216]KQM74811.1 short-chain dehydrogenase [Pedobacter sp. Leaf216]